MGDNQPRLEDIGQSRVETMDAGGPGRPSDLRAPRKGDPHIAKVLPRWLNRSISHAE